MKIMKNFFKVAVLAIALTTISITANAQTKGDMSAGAKFALGTGDGWSNMGFGANFRYNVTDPLRLEASFTYFLKKNFITQWDASVNAHWLFRVGEKVNVYPLAGIGILNTGVNLDLGLDEFGLGDMSTSVSDFAVNLGGGVDFFLTESVYINAELKYMIAAGGRLFLSAGVGFMF
jgi:outer membrane protein X